jgi:hypothetical protein
MTPAVGQLVAAGVIEEARRSARRSYNREYDHSHRIELRAKSRERYQERIPRVGARVLSAARPDPLYEQKHAITEYVICRVVDCGAKAKSLTPAHLRKLHRLTTAQYAKLFPGAPFLSSAVREGLGAKQRGRPRRNWRNVPGHPGEGRLPLWLVADGTVHGKPFEAIARSVRRHTDTVRHYASGLGLGSGWRRFDLGSRVTNGSLLRLIEATDFDSRRFAEEFGIPRWLAAESLKPSAANYDVSPTHANSIIDARDRLVSELDRLSRSTSHRWGPNLSKCLRSLVPELPHICRTLRNGLALSRDYLRANPKASIEDWQDWLCDETLRENEQGRRAAPFAAFLPLAVELSPMIEAELGSIRSNGRIVYVASRILGERFSLGYSVVLQGERARRLPPLELKASILAALALKRKPGKPGELIFSRALADKRKGLTNRQLAQKYLAPHYRRNPEGAIDRIKKGVKRLRLKAR